MYRDICVCIYRCIYICSIYVYIYAVYIDTCSVYVYVYISYVNRSHNTYIYVYISIYTIDKDSNGLTQDHGSYLFLDPVRIYFWNLLSYWAIILGTTICVVIVYIHIYIYCIK